VFGGSLNIFHTVVCCGIWRLDVRIGSNCSIGGFHAQGLTARVAEDTPVFEKMRSR
jgi:hypothetical protein